MHRDSRFWISALLGVALLAIGCGGESATEPQDAPNPARCELAKLGEAADLVESGKIPNDQLVEVEGIADPRTLVWREQKTGKIYFITRIMGTQKRMYYMEQLAPGEAPKLKSLFVGHLRRWDKLPPHEAKPMAQALLTEYKLQVEPEKTYLLAGGVKPDGCP